jgi:hypothetical protein
MTLLLKWRPTSFFRGFNDSFVILAAISVSARSVIGCSSIADADDQPAITVQIYNDPRAIMIVPRALQ